MVGQNKLMGTEYWGPRLWNGVGNTYLVHPSSSKYCLGHHLAIRVCAGTYVAYSYLQSIWVPTA